MTYEYKHFNEKLEERDLNKLGAQGWKLVNHSAVTDGYRVQQYYIFMREIEPTPVDLGPR
jgi:hypothetical protein